MLATGAEKQTALSNLPEEEQNHYFYTLDDAGRNIAYQRLSADGNGVSIILGVSSIPKAPVIVLSEAPS